MEARDDAAVDGAAWAEHCALRMMAEAARSVPGEVVADVSEPIV